MDLYTILGLLLLVILIILIIILIVKQSKLESQKDEVEKLQDSLEESKAKQQQIIGALGYIKQDIDTFQNQTVQNNADQIEKINKTVNDHTYKFMEATKGLSDEISKNLTEIRQTNEKKLTEIQGNISDKLDKSLNERLDKSFESVSKQLGELYKSLGELDKMQTGINSLNKTLTNVKTRGTWGEVQLNDILADTMQSSQYDRNVKLKTDSDDLVEFAIKIPSKDDDKTFVYMPIDSKFPSDRYIAVVEASQMGDPELLNKARSELKARILHEALTIRDKYIVPPTTTDFAVMFLPTESMYAEVLSIDGLAQDCQNKYRVIISGPSTITALLNSLRVGFENLTLSKKTQEVRKVLQAVKTQYDKLSELIDTTQKKIDGASKATSDLKKRTDMINSKLRNIETIGIEESNSVLEIDDKNILILDSKEDE